jgi:metallo-beta-lactamase family protein
VEAQVSALRKIATAIVALAFIAAAIWILRGAGGGEGVSVTFLGGAGEVGGSCTLVEAGETSLIVDCGSFGSRGDGILPEYPAGVDFMILTHAHSDHCGRIPDLFEAGFEGWVYCTRETAELVPVMLRMSRNFDRDKVDRAVFDRSLASLFPVEYGERITNGQVSIVFRRAQHLLGAAFVELTIDTGNKKNKIIFSGDLGSGGSILLPSIESPGEADYLILESTYGGRRRKSDDVPLHERYMDFGNAIGETLKEGGDVLIPAFTLGRTQEVFAALDMFAADGTIPSGTLFYSDSPTARKISDIYRKYGKSLSKTAREIYGDAPLRKSRHREVKSKTSVKVHERTHDPAVFISSSGDLQFANSPRHLARMAGDGKNLLCIVGWQSYGSVGRKLVEGDSTVCLTYREGGETKKVWVSPALKIMKFDAFSGHADQDGLVAWTARVDGLEKVFLVHGEPGQSEALAARLTEDLGIEAEVPAAGDRVFLPSR